ncbi:hypothetical protein B484DRAFT_393234 [Ochromonadaceae sp. CCMP2298]|nr:hypothetical protein B484DRAFT_393234 [Ochromonadaceae sp. CCMP2298]
MYGPAQPTAKAPRGATERAKRSRDDALVEVERLKSIVGADTADTATLLHGILPSLEVMAALKGTMWKRDVDLTTLRGLYTIDATITSIDFEHTHFTRLRDNRIATFVIPRALFDRTLSAILVRPAADGGLIRATVAIPVLCEIRADARIQLVVPMSYDQEGGVELVKITKAELILCAVVKHTLPPPEEMEDPPTKEKEEEIAPPLSNIQVLDPPASEEEISHFLTRPPEFANLTEFQVVNLQRQLNGRR